MNDIHIKNGINIYQNDDYIIYQMYTTDGLVYYISMPTTKDNSLDMTIDFKEEYYNSLLKNELIEQIKERCNLIYKHNKNTIYVLPNVSTYDLGMALKDNDNHAYEYIFNNLQKYVSHTYYGIINENISINQVISVIIETNDDKKFMHWLDINKKGFFKELDIDKVKNADTVESDTGTNPSKSGNSNDSLVNTANKSKTKVLIPKGNKHGYINISFIIITLVLSFTIGIGIVLLILS